jgi:hypothetical protein
VPITRVTFLAAAGALVALTAGCDSVTDTPSASPSLPGSTVTASTRPTPSRPADNGVAALPLKDAFARARAALAAARSVHLRADFGTGTGAGTVDVRILRGQGAVGSASFSGATVGLLRRGDTLYLHANAANWRKLGADAGGAQLLDGKYVRIPSSDKDFAELLDFTSVTGLAMLFEAPAGTPNVTVSWPRSTVRGTPVVEVGDPKQGAISIATTGQPYPLRVRATAGADRGSVEFMDYNRSVTLPTPAPSQIVTMPAS